MKIIAEYEVDSVNVAINADTEKAVKGIEKLLKVLDPLKKFSVKSADLEKVVKVTDKISSANPAKGVDTSGLSSYLKSIEKYGYQAFDDYNKNIAETQKVLQACDAVLAKTSHSFSSVGDKSAKAANQIGTLKNVLKTTGNAFSGIGKSAAGFIKSGLSKILDRIKVSLNGLNKELKYFTNAFKSMVTFSAFYGIMQAINESVKTGTDNLYQYSKALNGAFAQSMDSLAATLQYFQNSIAAAVSPLINALTPALETASDKIVDVTNSLNQMFAALTGASTWTKAVKVQKEYAEAAENAAQANKNLLAGFDELNVIQSKNSSSSSAATPNYSTMFEEVPLTDYKLPDIVTQLKNSFESGNWSEIGAILAEKVNSVFSSVNFESAARVIGEKLRTVIDTAKSFLANLDWSDIVQSVSGAITGFFEGLELGGVGEVISKVWQGVADGANWLWNNILSPFGEWLKNDFAPAFGETLTLSLDLFRAALEKLQPVWENVLKPLAEWTGEKLIQGIELINGVLETLIEKVNNLDLESLIDSVDWEKVAEVLKKVAAAIALVTTAVTAWKLLSPIITTLSTVIQGLATVFSLLSSPVGLAVTAIAAVIGIAALLEEKYGTLTTLTEGLGEKFAEVWNSIQTTFSTIWDQMKPLIQQFGDFFGTVFNGITTAVNSAIKGVMDILQGFVKFVGGVFTADWKLVIEGICDIFEGITGIFEGIIKGVIKIFIGMLNSIIDGVENAVNWIIDGINGLLAGVEKAGKWLGKDFSLQIPELSIPDIPIPQLANGGYVKNGQLFIANEAGAEMVGQIGNRTAVANNQQIIEGIRYGVASAMRDVVQSGTSESSDSDALLREVVHLLGEINRKDNTVTLAPSAALGRVNAKSNQMYAAMTGGY